MAKSQSSFKALNVTTDMEAIMALLKAVAAQNGENHDEI